MNVDHAKLMSQSVSVDRVKFPGGGPGGTGCPVDGAAANPRPPVDTQPASKPTSASFVPWVIKDDPTYNPNSDPNMNHATWTRIEQVN
jgi:hypothetical protein